MFLLLIISQGRGVALQNLLCCCGRERVNLVEGLLEGRSGRRVCKRLAAVQVLNEAVVPGDAGAVSPQALKAHQRLFKEHVCPSHIVLQGLLKLCAKRLQLCAFLCFRYPLNQLLI